MLITIEGQITQADAQLEANPLPVDQQSHFHPVLRVPYTLQSCSFQAGVTLKKVCTLRQGKKIKHKRSSLAAASIPKHTTAAPSDFGATILCRNGGTSAHTQALVNGKGSESTLVDQAAMCVS